MEIKFSNRTALITGATGELGRVMTRSFIECGANVIIHYHKNIEMAEILYKEAVSAGVRAFIVQADVTDSASIAEMKDKIEQNFTMPDIVVNNAVIQYNWKPLLEQDNKDYYSQFESCVMHNVYMAKAFIPSMIEKKNGRFIGINTECAIQTFPTQSAYSSAKRGMDGIYRVLAKEVGCHNITVNQVAPGWTVSERDRANGFSPSEYTELHPMRRRGTDEEVANAVIFLASELASFINGVYLPVTGGNVMPSI